MKPLGERVRSPIPRGDGGAAWGGPALAPLGGLPGRHERNRREYCVSCLDDRIASIGVNA